MGGAEMENRGLGAPTTHDLGSGAHAILDMETFEGLHAANVGIIATSKAIVFINSGQTESQARYVWSYARSVAPGRDMYYLILTHHHLDHCYASSFFDEKHTMIYAHRSFQECMAEMRKHLGAQDYTEMLANLLKTDEATLRQQVRSVHPVSPHRHVSEELSLAVNGQEIQIIHVPGHARSELVIYHPASRVLFAGDAINEKAGPVTMFGDPGDWRQWVAGLKKLAKLEIEQIVPGHGRICGPETIESHIETLETKIEEAS